MNKKLTALSLAAAMTLSGIGMAAVADEPIKILVNGEALNIPADDTQPFIENERTLVPMRAIFEALGASVEWDGETRTIVSYDPVSDVSITMQIDSATMFVGETPVELDVPAKIVNDRTVVPVRAIAEGMNSVVDWDGKTRTVIVDKDMDEDDHDHESAEIANPWTEYATLDELNAAINEKGEDKYQVADPSMPAEVNENGYRYLVTENLAEIQGVWAAGEGTGEFTIRTAPADADISGISDGESIEEFELSSGNTAELYKYENTYYVVWSCEDAGTMFSHYVAVTADDWDTADVAKQLADDVETGHPKG